MTDTEQRDLVLTRVLDVPVERVWEAWTKPEYVMQWWAPDHFTSPSAEMDFRNGGVSIVCMRAPKEWGRPGHVQYLGLPEDRAAAEHRIHPELERQRWPQCGPSSLRPSARLSSGSALSCDLQDSRSLQDRNDGHGVRLDRTPNDAPGRNRPEPVPRQGGCKLCDVLGARLSPVLFLFQRSFH